MNTFLIDQNRTRPPYQIKTIRCKTCDAPISMYSEHSQLVICDSCGEQLDCSAEELLALGKRPLFKSHISPKMPLHHEFLWDDIKYKVIARMIFANESGEKTIEYLLFHPFQGTRWLAAFHGHDGIEYSLSERNLVLARTDPLQMTADQRLKTEDDEWWLRDGQTVVTLEYVDGALPWLAKIGDTTLVTEYINQEKDEYYLTIEKSNISGSELEYCFSREISSKEVYGAFHGKSHDAPNVKPMKPAPLWVRISILLMLMGMTLYLTQKLFNYPMQRIEVGTYKYSLEDLRSELLTPTFFLDSKYDAQVMDLEINVDLKQNWYTLNGAIIRSPDTYSESTSYQELVQYENEHNLESEVNLLFGESFYHYSDDFYGQHRRINITTSFRKGGNYRLLLSGDTEAETIDGDVSIHLSIRELNPYSYIASIVTSIVGILVLLLSGRKRDDP
jgi:ribosomal protein S27E